MVHTLKFYILSFLFSTNSTKEFINMALCWNVYYFPKEITINLSMSIPYESLNTHCFLTEVKEMVLLHAYTCICMSYPVTEVTSTNKIEK